MRPKVKFKRSFVYTKTLIVSINGALTRKQVYAINSGI